MSGRAVFRFDASRLIGGGHAYRSLTLAHALVRGGWDIIVAARAETLKAIPLLVADFRTVVLECGEKDEASAIGVVVESADLLVVDHYGRDTVFERAARAWAQRILVIDDLANRPHDADLLLDQTYGRVAADYLPLVPPGCQLLLGAQYALLRPQFSAARSSALARRSAGGQPRKLLISVGAADTKRVSSRAVTALAGLPLEMDVVLGVEDSQCETIIELGARLGLNVRVHVDVVDMAALMTAADLAVGAAGSTSWERCCLGLPTIMLALADNQYGIASALHGAGAALSLGNIDSVTDADLRAAMETMRQDDGRRLAMAQHAAAICDGAGATRVVEALANA